MTDAKIGKNGLNQEPSKNGIVNINITTVFERKNNIMTELTSIIFGFFLIFIFIVVYFLPTIVALIRHHNNKVAILILNLLLGWTLVGWAGSLVWAFVNSTDKASR